MRRSARIFTLTALVLGLGVTALPVAAETGTVADSRIVVTETFDWAEVYVGSGEVEQGGTLKVTVSDLLNGRQIHVTVDTLVVPDPAPADQYGDTEFDVVIPADFPVGDHIMTITTNEFEPIQLPIKVTQGTAVPTPEPTVEPTPTEDPQVTSTAVAQPPAAKGPPEWAYGVLGGGAIVILLGTAVLALRKSKRA